MKFFVVCRKCFLVVILSLIVIEHIHTLHHHNIIDPTYRRFNINKLNRYRQVYTSVSSTSTVATSSVVGNELLLRLQSMKVTELKALLKRLGGSPGTLRKSEVIEACSKYLQSNYTAQLNRSYSTIGSSRDEKNSSTKPKSRLVMQPVVDKHNQINLFDTSKKVISVNITDMNSKQFINSSRKPSMSDDLENNSKRVNYSSENRQLRFEDEDNNSEMDLTFLGTASCIPTITRGVSCLAMRYQSDVWLFDCGESSQVQLQKSRIKPSRVKKIFITHTHGDHSFGLPGVLCLIGQSRLAEEASTDEQSEPVDIYGPEGIRDLIRGVIQLTYSRVVVPHRIHELKQVPYLHHMRQREPSASVVRTRYDPNYGEREGSRDIYPDANGHYTILDDEGFLVQAAPMQHTIRCVGYVVKEKDRVGSMKNELIVGIVEANKEALVKSPVLVNMKAKTYLRIYAYLKELSPGKSFVFPDGREVFPEDYMDAPKRGRKLVYMGDTCSGEMIAPLAMDADVLLHEATNAYLDDPNFDSVRHSNYLALEKETIMHGHSTPQMAGRFAKLIRAKRLILHHFSPRYPGDESPFSMRLMSIIENQARDTSDLWNNKNEVVAAWDQMSTVVPIPNHQKRAALQINNASTQKRYGPNLFPVPYSMYCTVFDISLRHTFMSDFHSSVAQRDEHATDTQASGTKEGRCHACGCVGPNPGSSAITSREEIIEHMKALREGHWDLAQDLKSIRRSFVCRNFKSAVSYINQVAEVAEREDIRHHPDIHLTSYRNIEIVLFTHAADGLTLYDFKLARAIDDLYIDYSPKWLKEHPEVTQFVKT